MTAKVHTTVPGDQLRNLAQLVDGLHLTTPDLHLAVQALHFLARYAPADKRVDWSIEWQTATGLADSKPPRP